MTAVFLVETTFFDGAILAAAILGVPAATWLLMHPPRVPARPRATPEVTEVLGLAALGVALYLVAHPWRFGHLQVSDPALFYSAFAAMKAVIAGVGLALGWRLCGGDPVGLRVESWRAVGWGAGIYALVIPGVMLLATFTDDGSRQSVVTALEEADVAMRVALFVYLVVVVPAFEELVFRGLIQGGLRRRATAVESIVVSSLLFVIVHPPSFWPSILLLALLFGWVYERTGTIWGPFCVHALHNALTYVLIVTDLGDLSHA